MVVEVDAIGRNDVPPSSGDHTRDIRALLSGLRAEAKALGFDRLVISGQRAPADWGGTSASPGKRVLLDMTLQR